MGVTPGKKTPKKSPHGKSPAVTKTELTAKAVKTPEMKTPAKNLEKNVSPQLSQKKKLDSKQNKGESKALKRKLDDDSENEVEVEKPTKDKETELQKKKKKNKKQRVENHSENKSGSAAVTDDNEDDEGGSASTPDNCKLFITGLGLERMLRQELKEFFKSHGFNLTHTLKQAASRCAFVGFATEEEAKEALRKLDKVECKGFPLSIETRNQMLLSLRLIRRISALPAGSTSDCYVYVTPINEVITRAKLAEAFPGVLVYRRKKKNWIRLQCPNHDYARELIETRQGTVIEGRTLKLESAEEFQMRVNKEQADQNKQRAEEHNATKKLKAEKQKEIAKKKDATAAENSKTASKEESSDEDDESSAAQSEEEDMSGTNDSSFESEEEEEEEEEPPKAKKAKVSRKH